MQTEKKYSGLNMMKFGRTQRHINNATKLGTSPSDSVFHQSWTAQTAFLHRRRICCWTPPWNKHLQQQQSIIKQVCIQLPMYDDNVALPAFASLMPTTEAIDRYLLPARPTAPAALYMQQDLWNGTVSVVRPSVPAWAHSKHAAAGLLLWAHAGTDRKTDIVPFHTSCSAYYAGSVNMQQTTPPTDNISAVIRLKTVGTVLNCSVWYCVPQ